MHVSPGVLISLVEQQLRFRRYTAHRDAADGSCRVKPPGRIALTFIVRNARLVKLDEVKVHDAIIFGLPYRM